jgi:hypothetical protein
MDAECTCNREDPCDLDEDEHYISCPVILTPEILRQLGFNVRDDGGPELVISKNENQRRSVMAKTALERESFKEVDLANVSDSIRDLAVRSRSVLGYKLVHSIVNRSKTLREVLVDLRIAPFSKRSVELYKAKKLREAQLQLKKEKNTEMEAHWRVILIQSYTEPIPETVLLKAIQLKEALPDVRLEIEQLSIAKPDPFLRASHNGQVFYVDVWDEPAFEDAVLKGAHIMKESDFDDED